MKQALDKDIGLAEVEALDWLANSLRFIISPALSMIVMKVKVVAIPAIVR